MFKPLFGYLVVFIIGFCVSPLANASTLILQSGQEIKGQIIDQTPLRVTIEDQGIPKTYFLGEVASIDGQTIEIPVVKSEAPPSVEIEKPKTPGNKVTSPAPPAPQKVSVASTPTPPQEHPAAVPVPTSDKLETLVDRIHEMTGKMLDMNKNVIPTPDGGVIVVTPDKITKYDKDLNLIKAVNLDPDNSTAGSK